MSPNLWRCEDNTQTTVYPNTVPQPGDDVLIIYTGTGAFEPYTLPGLPPFPQVGGFDIFGGSFNPSWPDIPTVMVTKTAPLSLDKVTTGPFTIDGEVEIENGGVLTLATDNPDGATIYGYGTVTIDRGGTLDFAKSPAGGLVKLATTINIDYDGGTTVSGNPLSAPATGPGLTAPLIEVPTSPTTDIQGHSLLTQKPEPSTSAAATRTSTRASGVPRASELEVSISQPTKWSSQAVTTLTATAAKIRQ